MATADETVAFARSFLGEGPDRFYAWYPAGPGTAWCCIFQSYVLTFSGAQDTHYAFVSYLFDAMAAQGREVALADAQRGDLVGFQYDGGGYLDHIAMVDTVERNDDGSVSALVCVNGNWTNKVVMVRHRVGASGFDGGISRLMRPAYQTPQPTPTEEIIVRRFIRAKSRPEVYLTDLMTKVHMTSEQSLRDMNYALTQSGLTPLAPPADAQVDTIAGVAVWVVSDQFAATIPTVS